VEGRRAFAETVAAGSAFAPRIEAAGTMGGNAAGNWSGAGAYGSGVDPFSVAEVGAA
jgi:hypothetical protein